MFTVGVVPDVRLATLRGEPVPVEAAGSPVVADGPRIGVLLTPDAMLLTPGVLTLRAV